MEHNDGHKVHAILEDGYVRPEIACPFEGTARPTGKCIIEGTCQVKLAVDDAGWEVFKTPKNEPIGVGLSVHELTWEWDKDEELWAEVK